MTRVLVAVLILLASVPLLAADDFKVSQLEQDVRELQRQVLAQSQQISELRLRLAQPTIQSGVQNAPPPPPSSGITWLDASKWQRLKAGMSEMQVISLLGPPTTMRGTEGERVLVYAMEIGPSQFLSGSVTLHDRNVLTVQVPVLR
jgi:hypothetical protein